VGRDAGPRIVLSPDDLEWALGVGFARYERSEVQGYARGVITTMDNRERHLQAACSELAVARYLDADWLGSDPDAFHAVPDVAPDVEVRRARARDWGLLVTDRDVPERRYVLAFGRQGRWEILGWCRGDAAGRRVDRLEGRIVDDLLDPWELA
jgi:hypothetical protein